MPIEAQKLVTRFEGDDKHLSRTFSAVERKTGQHLTKVENLYRNTQGRLVAASNAMASSIGGSTGLLPGMAHISEIIQGIPQIGRLAGGLIRPLTDAAQEGIRLNMVLETAEIGFEGIAGSSKKAKEHIAALMAFGQRSPFRFEGLLEASRFMTAFGFSLEEQIPKLTIWGNAIAASGELSADKINDVVRAFGQMRLAGRVNAQDMNQLTNANIPGWELLARAIGKTVAETRRLAEAGKLQGGPAVEAITAAMSVDPRYKNMMKRMEATGAGRLSAAQDILQFGQAKATAGLTQDISATLGAALQKEDLVGQVATAINAAIAPVSAMIRTAAVGMLGGGLTEGLVEGIQAGKDAVKQAVGDLAMDGIIGTAKSWLGIQSPSTVFYEMGLMSAAGFALGLKDGFKENPLVEELKKLLEDPRIRAFMEAIKKAEGGEANRIVGYGGTFSDFSKHPNKVGLRTAAGPSTAAGSWQITGTTWRRISKILGLPDFSEPSQLLAALELFKRTGGVAKLQSGDFAGAVKAAGNEWQSLPGSSLGGKYHVSQQKFQGLYQQALTSLAFSGREVSATNPLPVYFAQAHGGAGRVGTADPLGGAQNISRPMGVGGQISSSFGGFTFKDVTWTDSKAKFVIDSFKSAEDQMIAVTETANVLTNQILPRAIDGTNVLGDAALNAAQDQQQLLFEMGQWMKYVTGQIPSVKERLSALASSLPTLGEEMNDILVSLPARVGDIWGSAIQQWDGSFKGFLSSLAQGVQQTLQDIASQLAASAVTKILTSLLGAVIGGGISGSIPSLNIGSTWGLSGRASGGPVNANTPYIVGERGQELFIPKTSGQIVPNSRMGGTTINNISVTVPVSRGNSFHQRQTQRQIAERIGGMLAA